MNLFLIILVIAILHEQFTEKEPCNCPGKCKLHKDIYGNRWPVSVLRWVRVYNSNATGRKSDNDSVANP